MSPLQIITQLLLQNDEVAGLVGGHIRSFQAEQGLAPPYIVLQLAGGGDEQLLIGSAKYPDKRVSVAVISLDGVEADDIGNAVIRALGDVVKQTVTSAEGSPSEVIAHDVDVIESDSDYTDWSEDQTTVRRVIDFNVRWRNP